MTPLHAAARTYAENGLSVIPLRCIGDAKERKRPAVASWIEFQEVAADLAQLDRWWTHSDFNVGIVTGSVSQLVVIDLDGPNAVALLKEKGYHLPATSAVQTGKGYHAYFRHSGEVIQNRTAILTDSRGSAVDVRGEGGYVVAPPSIHGNGRVYQWARPLSEIQILPPELEELLLSGEPDILVPTATQDDAWWERVKEGVGEGERNDAAARVAGYWIRLTGGNIEATFRACILWNHSNRPPLAADELQNTISSVARAHKRHELAEASKAMPRVEVLDGAAWAEKIRTSRPREGEATGMPGLHYINGLVPGDLVVLAGRPGMGKSTYGTQLTAAVMQRQIPTWVVSCEMGYTQWADWIHPVYLACRFDEVPNPLPERALNFFNQAPIRITEKGHMKIDELVSVAEGMAGTRLIIVDNLAKLSGNHKDNRVQDVGDVVRGLKALAKDLHCTVLLLCHLSRAVEARESRRPRLADLRESGEIEAEADVVFTLWSPTEHQRNDPGPQQVTMSMEKYRFGANYDIRLTHLRAERRFVEGWEV